ncbi:tRNA epoxyqueuosine(34) reductase QueG [Hyphomicrobiales bacterium]|jgi:epoxyqueuosine reductase|nr:tRNA epoxyqueuosine(34) reductase QueG [Hyphomicrobiales bacterium]|tara:strand:- start:530 stop:1663 length:1134 start_codon:yes stop_codon:yes gene_type:complete
MNIAEEIGEKALEIGFDDFGFTDLTTSSDIKNNFLSFLEKGNHGDMLWLENNVERRVDPLVMWGEAKTALVLAQNYAPDNNPIDNLKLKNRANISVYARGDDYHKVIKKKLKSLAGWMAREYKTEVKVFVDTAPIMEKPLAQSSGIGWQGKHTNLVSKNYGSWLFLGVILISIKLPVNVSENDHCGTCQACIDVCPTKAFPKPYQLDARKCISYLTIEHKGHIPLKYRSAIGNRVYGCDDCLAVCPWNKFAKTARENRLRSRELLNMPELSGFLDFDDFQFRQFFSGSPIKRIGRNKFLRNVIIAIGNSGQIRNIGKLKEKLTDESSLVRAMAVWALSCLMNFEDFNNLKKSYFSVEVDKNVIEEWKIAFNKKGFIG